MVLLDRTAAGWVRWTRGPVAATLLLACQASSRSAQVPEWPEQMPPEYPGVAPRTQAGASEPVEPGAQATSGSASPLAASHADRTALERLNGKATYYSDALAGNSTASGEPYRPEAFTAAHRSLPFGTVVRVTRQDTPRSTYVVINDRGPFAGKERIIDLSRAAASELQMLRAGVVPVSVEVLELPEQAKTRPR